MEEELAALLEAAGVAAGAAGAEAEALSLEPDLDSDLESGFPSFAAAESEPTVASADFAPPLPA